MLVVFVALVACGPPKHEAIDAEHLAGRWMLDTGEETEWFHLDADGTFSAEIRGDGFIATTLGQGPPVELIGHWTLDDRTLTFVVDESKDDALVGETHIYEITELTDPYLITIDSAGKKDKLLRGR